MLMQKGQRYQCQNPECGAEIEVTKDSVEGAYPLRCCCGAAMKRPYNKPAVKTRTVVSPSQQIIQKA